jgi:hypothetical protein
MGECCWCGEEVPMSHQCEVLANLMATGNEIDAYAQIAS